MTARTRSVRWAGNAVRGGGCKLDGGQDRSSSIGTVSRRIGLCAGIVLALAAGVLVGRLSMMGSARSAGGVVSADMGGWHSEGLAVAAVVVVTLILLAGRGFEAISCGDRREPSNVRPADLSQLSHELRTPLNAIIGFSEVMQHNMLGPIGHPRYEEYVRHISANGHELKRGIEQVLADAEAAARRDHVRVH